VTPLPLTHYREGVATEELAGYARARRVGPMIAVSGTTALIDRTRPSGTYEQTRDCLERVIRAVEQLGGAAASIARTRVFLGPGAAWEDAARAHRELLGDFEPANTMLWVAGIIGEGLLVEVEAEAWAGPAV